MLIRIDGVEYRRPEEARISVFDHGFLFGDSVYEVIRTYGGFPYEVEPHLARLFQSAARIALEIGRSAADLAAEIEDAVRAAALPGEAYIRLIVTRGVGALSIDPASCAHPSTVLIVKPLEPWPARYYDEGIAVRVVSVVRNEPGSVDPAIKTGNYLNSVLALIEARRAGADEAVMLNAHGQLTESTTSNVFLVKDGEVITPALSSGILSGITRAAVLRLCREQGIPRRETVLTAGALYAADEAFLTSTTRGIMPIAKVDGHPIGAGRPGPLTCRLRAAFAAEVERFVAARRQQAAG
ncbi:MAG: branched chain amino acid aminotransferase [Planctomycetota bacterium]|nr:MAG: branched chain amino acid aminotransferase [Planctomycetota bacterium]